MDTNAYAVEAVVEENHWWFVCRRELFAREIAKLNVAVDTPVLDVGTSTGTNLRMLRELGFTDVVGLDASTEAIRYCAMKGLPPVRQGDVCSLPFADKQFGLVLATDILEHVDDDLRALSELRRVLAPGGFCLLTVPTFESLWGLQDDVAHHLRRYRLPGLLSIVRQARLTTMTSYYFNYLLFVPIWVARRLIRLLRIELASENEVGTPFTNRILRSVFGFDVRTAGALRPPFGVSALAIARRDIEIDDAAA